VEVGMKGEFILGDKELQQNGREILHIPIGQVVSGMITARDIFSRNDQLVLAKDTVLEPNMIAKIMFYAIQSIYVYQPEDQPQKDTSYYERIQKSIEFKKFHLAYKEVLREIKDSVNQMIRSNRQIDETQLINSVKKIIIKGKSRYHFLELIYSVHEHDDMTFAHSINVALICNLFAQWLHMDEADSDTLTICGLMHDVGKMAIPIEILNKPGKLTKDEYDVMKEHPEQGYLMLLKQKVDPRVRLATLQHHERFDGSGYPMSKTGEKIHPFAMITAIADVFDAMTSNRVYRNAICPFSVLEMFEGEGKHKYDLAVVLPLMERIAEIYINHTVRLSNNTQGEVIMVNCHALSRPVVKVGDVFLDLSKHMDVRIEAVI
jgi:putative nucleotidyltransferase with HDIG domain